MARFVEFVWLPTFERTARGLLSEEDRRRLEVVLLENPERGAVVAGTGGFRKVRFRLPSRGKSGSVRVIYLHAVRRHRIYMLLVYAKSVKESLADAEENELRRIAGALKAEE